MKLVSDGKSNEKYRWHKMYTCSISSMLCWKSLRYSRIQIHSIFLPFRQRDRNFPSACVSVSGHDFLQLLFLLFSEWELNSILFFMNANPSKTLGQWSLLYSVQLGYYPALRNYSKAFQSCFILLCKAGITSTLQYCYVSIFKNNLKHSYSSAKTYKRFKYLRSLASLKFINILITSINVKTKLALFILNFLRVFPWTQQINARLKRCSYLPFPYLAHKHIQVSMHGSQVIHLTFNLGLAPFYKILWHWVMQYNNWNCPEITWCLCWLSKHCSW